MANALGFQESESNSSWLSGTAAFKFSGDETRVKAKVTDRKGKATTVTFPASLLPKVPETISEEQPYGVSIRLDEDGDVDEIETIYPANWMGEVMKPVDISRMDDVPAPIDISFDKGGKTISYQMFIVYLEFVSNEEFKGARVPYWLKYAFIPRADGNTQFSGNPDNPKAHQIRKTFEFCDVTDCIGEDIPWAEDGNILPELWARIEDEGKLLLTSGKNAEVETLLPYEAEPIKSKKPAESQQKEKSKEVDDFDDDEF